MKILLFAIFLLLPQICMASLSCNLEIDKNKYKPGETIIGILTIENLNYTGSGAGMLISYSIENDNLISEKTTTIYLENERTNVLKLDLPEDIQPGDYFFTVNINYLGDRYKIQDSFCVKGNSSVISPESIFVLFTMLLAVIIFYKKYK